MPESSSVKGTILIVAFSRTGAEGTRVPEEIAAEADQYTLALTCKAE
jgi:hypothetical protein